MKRRRKIVIGLIALVLCGVLAAVLWPEKPEPVYEGRKLSKCIMDAAKRGRFATADLHAIEAIGTNGIPHYLQWIRYRPGVLKKAEIRLAVKCRDWLHITWIADRGGLRAWYAFLALGQLGERGTPAIPQFIACITNSAPPFLSLPRLPSDAAAAVEGLANIGSPALPAYLSLLTNADPQIRAFAIMQSQRFHSYNSVIAQLKNSLEDPDRQVRFSATNALRAYDRSMGGPSYIPAR